MKTKILSLIILLSLLFTSCTTIGTQQYTYVGDVTPKENVMGKSLHIDFLGLGISANSYAREYNNAVTDAFNNASPKPSKLTSTKIFKETTFWPKILGSLLVVAGQVMLTMQISNTQDTQTTNLFLPILLFTGGGALWGVNTYNFVVVGEPVY